MSLFICAVRHRRCGSAPNGGTACRIGNHHSVAKELGDYLQIRCLAAACARAGKFEVRLIKLAAFDTLLIYRKFFLWNGHGIIPVVRFSNYIGIGFHLQCLFLSRTDICAVSAAHTVEGGKLHSVVESVKLRTLRLDGFKSLWRSCQFLVIQKYRSDCRVRANEGALIALDTFCHIPLRQMYGYAALFVSAGSKREGSVRVVDKGADRKILAFLLVHRNQHFFYEYR